VFDKIQTVQPGAIVGAPRSEPATVDPSARSDNAAFDPLTLTKMPLPRHPAHRAPAVKKYCSGRCRTAAWRTRRAGIDYPPNFGEAPINT
jgi:hypothetical protein